MTEEATRRSGAQSVFWRTAEALAWLAAAVCLAGWSAWCVGGAIGKSEALREFSRLHAAGQQQATTPDLSLWSQMRIDAWRSALRVPGPAPIAVLRIARIGLEVPVLEGTDELTLNRGVGHIEGTAVPGSGGNSGIAGHRDGYFRVLKDVASGDEIELETLNSKQTYRIQKTWIVVPEDVSVLDSTPGRALTLVTCYPFYFVGPAPRRYIVRAIDVSGKDLSVGLKLPAGVRPFE